MSSLKNYEPEYLKSKLENKLVFTIKQSYLLLKEICDFHILNFTNFEPYQWLDETIGSGKCLNNITHK